jgi:hypothetical protein
MLRKTLIEDRVWNCLTVLIGKHCFQAGKLGVLRGSKRGCSEERKTRKEGTAEGNGI